MNPVETVQVRAIDLEIRVTTPWGPEGRGLNYVLNSPSGAVDFVQEPVRGPLVHSPKDFQRSLFLQFEAFQRGQEIDGNPLLQEDLPRELEAIGHDLYHQLFPRELRGIYREVRDRVKTLVILSDEPWIPWEIVRPREFPDDDFLCMRFQLSRWLTGESSLVTEKRVRRLLGLEALRGRGLPAASAEVRNLQQIMAGIVGLESSFQSPSHFKDMIECLERGRFDLLHVTGHSQHDDDHPAESAISLTDRPFRARHLAGTAQKRLRADRPIVVFNGCQIGRLGQSLTQVEGWPARWIRRCGCSAFLAPLWSVRDDRARRFAQIFYAQLLEGETLGGSVLAARRTLRQEAPGEMSWLAYSLYGHPNAQIAFGDRPFAASDYSPEPRSETTGSPSLAEVLPEEVQPSSRPPEARNKGLSPFRRPREQRASIQARNPLPPVRIRTLTIGALGLALAISLTLLNPWAPRPESPEGPGTSKSQVPAEGAGLTEPTAGESGIDGKTIGGAAEDPISLLPTQPEVVNPTSQTTDGTESQELQTSRPQWLFPVALPESGKLVILVLDSATKRNDLELAQAVESVLAQKASDLSLSTPYTDPAFIERLLEGDPSALPTGGETPWGAEYLLVGSASRTRLPGSSSAFPKLNLTLRALLVNPADGSTRLRTTSTQTGTGPSIEQALTQAAERCLEKITSFLVGEEHG